MDRSAQIIQTSWIGINPNTAPDDLLKKLTQNSYEIVKAKYASKRGQKQNLFGLCRA